MGIRMFCPNGHKLNLKSFLAGKRGVCPHCGAKFDIPEQGGGDKPTAAADTASPGQQPQTSDATGGSAAIAPTGIAADASSGPAQTPIVPSTVSPPSSSPQSPASSIPGQSAGTTPQTSAPPASAAAENLAPVQPVAATPQIAPVQAASPAPTGDQGADLLSEAPDACWYVRPPTGGQYGPAKSDVMRQWIDEGRVTPDSLVWREGWSDWQSARMLFPSLSAGSVTTASIGTPSMQTATDVPTASIVGEGAGAFPSMGPSSSSGRQATNYRRKDHTGRVMAIGFLCLALIVLTVLLVYVLVY